MNTEMKTADITYAMYRVWIYALGRNSEWFLRKFGDSLNSVYGTCPTPLNAITLKEFLKTSDPDDFCEWFRVIQHWKRWLEKKYPDHYERFDEIYETFVIEDSEPPEAREARKAREAEAREAEAREAEAREVKARKHQEWLEYCQRLRASRVLSTGEWPSAKGPSITAKKWSGFF
jgi:hypothetical protein